MNQIKHILNSPLINIVRRTLGYFFLAIGILGAILPIIPGWPGFIIAIILLGRRDRSLRRLHLFGRRLLRSLRQARNRRVRSIGQRLSQEYVEVRRQITPFILQAERFFSMKPAAGQ